MNVFTASQPQDGAEHLVTVSGELDMATVPQLEAYLSPLDGEVRLDCTQLSFVDSRGVNLIVQTHRRLADNGGRLIVAGLTPNCRRVIEVMSLEHVLHLTD